MPDDRDVRAGGANGVILRQWPQVALVPGLAENGGQGIPLPGGHFQYTGKFFLNEEEPLVRHARIDHFSVLIVARIADRVDDALTGRETTSDTIFGPIRIDL